MSEQQQLEADERPQHVIEKVENLHIGDTHHHHHEHHHHHHHTATESQDMEMEEPNHGSEQPINDHDQEVLEVEAIVKVAARMKLKLFDDVVLHGLNANQEAIPIVFPVFVLSDFFQHHVPATRWRLKSSVRREVNEKIIAHQTRVQFADIINNIGRKHFLALIGPPGSGKTTCSRRLAKIDQSDLVVLYFRFMDINYGSQKLTLKQLLIDNTFPELDEMTRHYAFQWVCKNSDKCVFVLDGYDQAGWSLKNVVPLNEAFSTSMTVDHLVANLCSGVFFRNSLVILTARPHSMASIPAGYRPDATIFVHDLSTEDMKKLFFALAGERAEKLWKILSIKAPQLLDLCHTPVLLQFILCACLAPNQGSVANVMPHTITEVFQRVLVSLTLSKFKRGRDLNTLCKPLGRMVYLGMVRRTAVFSLVDLEREDLKDVDVQDFVIVINGAVDFVQMLFDGGDKQFYFIHQMLQEIFAAMFIALFMPFDEFLQIVSQVVSNGHWMMVRRFLCGLLLGEKCESDKSSTFCTELLRSFHTWGHQTHSSRELLELFIDLQECNNQVKEKFASYCPSEYWFSGMPISSSGAYALGQMLPKMKQPIDKIDLLNCNLESVSMKHILQGVQHMKHGVKELILTSNLVGQNIEDLALSVRNITHLDARNCGITTINCLCKEIETHKIQMKKLQLSRNPIGNNGIESLANCIEYIDELDLGECGITSVVRLTEKLLCRLTEMKVLYLSGNNIGNWGINCLAQSIGMLKQLYVEECGITDVHALTQKISSRNSQVELLDLGRNALGDSGAENLNSPM